MTDVGESPLHGRWASLDVTCRMLTARLRCAAPSLFRPQVPREVPRDAALRPRRGGDRRRRPRRAPPVDRSGRSGKPRVIYDLDARAVDTINAGGLPFLEPGAQELLRRRWNPARCWRRRRPRWSPTPRTLVVVIGTPVDEHLNPDPQRDTRALETVRSSIPRRPAPRPAQHRLPGGDPLVERFSPTREVDRRRLLPRADRRGEGHGGARPLPQIVSAAPSAVPQRAAELFGT